DDCGNVWAMGALILSGRRCAQSIQQLATRCEPASGIISPASCAQKIVQAKRTFVQRQAAIYRVRLSVILLWMAEYQKRKEMSA
ncbi:hypothetical protein, partial [Paraburkholderia sp. J8-2]|uniref:hypothetical protein n=1 Tax=Paraburkholderia sp. J8-2 TaxID=2805440 RepID=UPI002AB618BA